MRAELDLLAMVGRDHRLLDPDLERHREALADKVSSSRFLVIGGAGSIGQAVVKELFRRSPQALHVVDLSENNLVELVRDLRSDLGYIDGDFQTVALDAASLEFDAFVAAQSGYDVVVNLAALKHVRSERDPYTLMRMIEVNVGLTDRTAQLAAAAGANRYFAVSTDKATNPVNMMGASKRVMESVLARHSAHLTVSAARFANVAFSDGSLLQGFERRLAKRQPLVAPSDVRRYFVTPREAGELCLVAALLGGNREIIFPHLNEGEHLVSFAEIAERFLHSHGLSPVLVASEEEAREQVRRGPVRGGWPLLLTTSDTTGEKAFEEFYTADDVVDWGRFETMGVLTEAIRTDEERLSRFQADVARLRQQGHWERSDLVQALIQAVPELDHDDTGLSLESKM